jgi:hypothetical protein
MEPVTASAVAEAPTDTIPKRSHKKQPEAAAVPKPSQKKPRYPKKERTTADFVQAKPKDIVLPPLGDKAAPLPSNTNLVESVESPLEKEYLDALKFNEDPLSIVVAGGSEKYAPKFVECWVQGKGIEVLIGNRWHEFKAIPVNKVVVTKRKYVEVLLRQKRMDVDNVITTTEDGDKQNTITRSLAQVHGISIRHDPSPKGPEWFERIISLGQ